MTVDWLFGGSSGLTVGLKPGGSAAGDWVIEANRLGLPRLRVLVFVFMLHRCYVY